MLNLNIYNSNQIKSFHISRKINHFYNLNGSNIVEVGAGFGGQCISLCALYDIKKYLIIDLDEMINFSFKMTSDCLTDYVFIDCRLIADCKALQTLMSNNQKIVFFVTPEIFINNIDVFKNRFHIGLNVDSFQEMTLEQVDEYISYMEMLIRPNGIFMNINRKKYLPLEKEVNNPLTYRFFGDLIHFDVDEYFDFINKNLYFRSENWYCRIEKKRFSNVSS